MINLNSKARRDFLKNICNAGMLIPFTSQFLLGGRALAASGRPHRLITVYYPNGAVLDAWHPKQTGRISQSSSLSYCFEPLRPYADRLMPLRQLTTKGHGGSSSHPEAAGKVFSGGDSSRPSLDVGIANDLNNSNTLKYFHLGVFNRYNNGKDYLPYRDALGQSILPEDDPQKVANQLFGEGGNSEDRQRNLEILEIIGDDLAKLRRADLNAQTTEKLDVHEQSLNHLEALIQGNLNVANSCAPIKNISMGLDRRENNIRAEEIVLSQFDNIVGAFRCDLTRVMSFQFMAAQDESMFINFDSISSELDAADSGGFGSTRRWWNQNLSHPSSHEGNQVYRVQNKWYNMMMAALCEKLDRVPDPLGGGSLLDTSLICVFSENGQSANHGQDDVGWYLLGGGNGVFDMGKVLDVRGKGSSDLLLEIARAMGLSWNRFGNSSSGIPGLY